LKLRAATIQKTTPNTVEKGLERSGEAQHSIAPECLCSSSVLTRTSARTPTTNPHSGRGGESTRYATPSTSVDGRNTATGPSSSCMCPSAGAEAGARGQLNSDSVPALPSRPSRPRPSYPSFGSHAGACHAHATGFGALGAVVERAGWIWDIRAGPKCPDQGQASPQLPRVHVRSVGATSYRA